MTTRWMRPPEIERPRDRNEFDPVAEGSRYRLAPEVSLAIWERVCGEAGAHTAHMDRRADEPARRRFHELAARIAARGGRLRPDVGRTTRVEAEDGGTSREAWSIDELAPRVPGRQTLVSASERSRQPEGEDAAAVHGSEERSRRIDPPGARAVTQAIEALRAPGRQDLAVLLEPDVGARMSRLFGVDLTRVAVVPESLAVAGSTKAVTKGDEVHFRPGAYQPGTSEGDWLIAHELAHIVQQRGERGERTGTRKEIEREADRAASLVARGHAASIHLRAERAGTYAFDEGEVHDADVEDTQLEHIDKHDKDGDAAKSRGPDADAAKPGAGKHPPDDAAPLDSAKGAAAETEGAEREAADGGGEAGIGDGEAEISAVIPAEDAPAGPPGVGGGPPAKPQKAPPSVAAARPEAALTQLQGVRPDRLTLLFGQVHTAAGADVAKERTKLAANPPKQMSTGAPAAARGGAAAGGASAGAAKGGATDPKATGAGAGAAADPKAHEHEMPDHPVKGEVPGGESDKQAKQGQAAEQQKSAPQMIASVARSISSWFGSWFGHGEHGDDKTPKMSEAETRQMSGSLDQLPTTVQGVSTDPGPAPELAMKGEAKTTADQDRKKLEAQAAGLETQGRADSRAPMGEDHIDPTAAPEELAATAAAGGAAPADAALPTLAGTATSEEVGIVAQEQSGAEIDAALTKASGDAAAERAKHAQEETKARAESDAHVRELKTQADADQAAARTAAQAEVTEARGQWQTEIDKKGRDARTQADKKVADGMAQVLAEEAKANAEAKQHVDEGKRKAEDEKQKGEKEAADAKEKGKEKSSGFFGWLASKAKAAFDGIKKAVHAAIDACKKAVKAVIDAAKKLAMAAIELARKVIVAAIKAVGQALIAISNVLLAAFPGLKAKFQGLIRKAVDKAVNTVNKLADGLKKAVQKALDALGAALDKALGLLEKGLDAIIDAANAVVQGAIQAAQAVVDALGTWVKLIKDIASAPGAWLSKLGAAVVDGIKNHLWSAFKTAVVDWFKSKVFELLGVGGIILQLLLEGGLTREHITQMALDALMVAIPAALVAILIEKLVSMIVPAAGAVMAVIEGLQAAWGTISRIIAAFSAFMAFLLAVKGGTAGALFAAVLASAAVVVLDFVANWLLKKLASAAKKVGAKLKGLAEKFKAKRKAKKDAKSPKKDHDAPTVPGNKKKNDHDDHDGPGGKKKNHDDDPKKVSEDKKREDETRKKQERLQRAVAAIRPPLAELLRRGVSGWSLKMRLAAWRIRYRLTKLQLEGQRIVATINPSDDVAGAKKLEALGRALEPILVRAEREYQEQLMRNPDAAKRIEGNRQRWRTGQDLEPGDRGEVAAALSGPGAQRNASFEPSVTGRQRIEGHPGTTYVSMGSVSAYDKILASLEKQRVAMGMSQAEVGDLLGSKNRAELDERLERHAQALEAQGKPGNAKKLRRWHTLRRAAFLMNAVEPTRVPGSMSTAAVGLALVSGGHASLDDVLSSEGALAPATPKGAASQVDDEQRAKAERARHRRTARTFLRLRRVAQSETIFVSGAEDFALDRLAQTVDQWLRAHIRGLKGDDMEDIEGQLVLELKALLKRTFG